MPKIDYMKHFARDPHICDGQTVIHGTRVPLRIVLATLADGETPEDVVRHFPTVKIEDVWAAIAFAAAAAEEDIPVLGAPTHAG